MFPTARSLAATYNPPEDVGRWERVKQYREVMEYPVKHPDAGSSAVNSTVDQPRERLQP